MVAPLLLPHYHFELQLYAIQTLGVPVDPEVYITIAVSCGVGDMIASWPVGLDDRILAPYD